VTGLPDVSGRTLLSAYERALADRPDNLAPTQKVIKH
jgi:hypothetical protein